MWFGIFISTLVNGASGYGGPSADADAAGDPALLTSPGLYRGSSRMDCRSAAASRRPRALRCATSGVHHRWATGIVGSCHLWATPLRQRARRAPVPERSLAPRGTHGRARSREWLLPPGRSIDPPSER